MQVNVKQIVAAIEQFKARQAAPLKRQLARLDAERAKLVEAIEMLNGSAGQRTVPAPRTASAAPMRAVKAPRKRKRIRRSLADVQAEARRIVDFVKNAKDKGVSGALLRNRFPGIKGTILQYVNQYAGTKLKSKGMKSQMRYYA